MLGIATDREMRNQIRTNLGQEIPGLLVVGQGRRQVGVLGQQTLLQLIQARITVEFPPAFARQLISGCTAHPGADRLIMFGERHLRLLVLRGQRTGPQGQERRKRSEQAFRVFHWQPPSSRYWRYALRHHRPGWLWMTRSEACSPYPSSTVLPKSRWMVTV